jgi:hypothetical protein
MRITNQRVLGWLGFEPVDHRPPSHMSVDLPLNHWLRLTWHIIKVRALSYNTPQP